MDWLAYCSEFGDMVADVLPAFKCVIEIFTKQPPVTSRLGLLRPQIVSQDVVLEAEICKRLFRAYCLNRFAPVLLAQYHSEFRALMSPIVRENSHIIFAIFFIAASSILIVAAGTCKVSLYACLGHR